ncbi:MAG TPA: ribosome maturation factor RimM [Chitinophagales bacterium]|nr:ribosome maturation factor RimM [Chitinophagales bacterium]HNM31536.1 ribosome maturation factor RimM [Chitinophagales bacterium]
MELIKIGKIGKTHGFKGHLKVLIDEFYMQDFEDMKVVFIQQLPYFILHKDINTTSQVIILLEDIDTKEKAQRLQGKELYAKDDDLTEILDEAAYQELIGFEIIDKNQGIIGKIEQIIEMPFQVMAQLFKDKKEILVPLNDNFILNINTAKKQVEMQLPDGFLAIFN